MTVKYLSTFWRIVFFSSLVSNLGPFTVEIKASRSSQRQLLFTVPVDNRYQSRSLESLEIKDFKHKLLRKST